MEGNESGYGEYQSRRPAAPHAEKLRVWSGLLLILDQFMLANDQFISQVPKESLEDQATRDSLKTITAMYGGCLVPLAAGDWEVYRDPMESLLLVLPAGERAESGDEEDDDKSAIREAVTEARGNALPLHRVFVDTRCIVFLDAEVLHDRELLEEYKSRRQAGDEKGARDLLREKGAAVRYGFNREGDELGVFKIPDLELFALWPNSNHIEPR